jgi:FkbM family methyltransferase
LRRNAGSVTLRRLDALSKIGAPVLPLLFRIFLAIDRRFIKYAGNNFETMTNTYRGKFTVFVNSKYLIERHIFIDDYELENIKLMTKIVAPGDIAMDVGANVGAVTLPLAELVGPSGQVHSFEPGIPIFDRLARNVRHNPSVSGRIFPNHIGLSDKEGELVWREFAHMPGNAGFHEPNGKWTASSSYRVPVTTLDAYVARKGLQRVNFIKIDTEGFEPMVLRGARDTLQKFRPLLIVETLQEYQEMPGADYFRRIEESMWKLDYVLFKFNGRLSKASPEDHSQDTVCIPVEKVNEISNRICG